MNISCPNVKAGGLAYGTRPELAARSHPGGQGSRRLGPSDGEALTQCDGHHGDRPGGGRAGADALSLINTLRGMRIDVNTRRPVLKMNTGGLSGPAVLPVAVRMVWGGGPGGGPAHPGDGRGVKGEDAAQMMLAGASAVAVGTALFADPYAPSGCGTSWPPWRPARAWSGRRSSSAE